MMATLIIRIYADQRKVLMHFNDDGVLEHHDDLPSFSDVKDNDGKKLIVLISGFNVHMLPVDLPTMSTSELQQAVPNILEEQLSEDINDLYFAIGEADADNRRFVAIMQKTAWETLIDQLKENNLSPDVIMPDYLALPITKDSWTIYCDNEQSLVRLAPQQGFSCDLDLLETLIQLNLNEVTDAPNQVRLIHDLQAHVPQLELATPANTEMHSFTDILDPDALIANPPFNMLQRQFRKKRSRKQRSYWYWCGVSFAALIAFFFIGQIALYISFKIRSHSLNNQLLATYQRIFPGTTQLSEPKLRVEEQLKAYELTPNPFITILERVGRVKSQNANIEINTINYTNNKATLVIVANNNTQLNQFNKALSSAGLKITSNQTRASDKQITETLTVEAL